MLQIDGHRNRRHPIEELPHDLDFLGNLLLRCRAQMTVAGRNGRLHRWILHRRVDRGLPGEPPPAANSETLNCTHLHFA